MSSGKPVNGLMDVPPFDLSRMMDLHQKNLAAMTRVWLAAADGIGAIAARQQELAVAAWTDMKDMLQCYQPGGDPQKATAVQGEFANKAMEAVFANMRNIAELIQNSGAEAFSLVRENIAAQAADWLSDPANSAMLANFVLDRLPPALAAIDRSSLPSLIGEQVRTELRSIEIAPLTAGLLSAEVEKGRHQRVLDQVLNVLEALVCNTPVMETLRQRIRAELPSVFNLYRGEPVVMNKIVEMTMGLITDIRTDPVHPLRVELDGYLRALISRLRSSPEFASGVETVKRDLLDRPELADLAVSTWNGLRDFLLRDVRSEESLLRCQFEAMLSGAAAERTPHSSDRA